MCCTNKSFRTRIAIVDFILLILAGLEATLYCILTFVGPRKDTIPGLAGTVFLGLFALACFIGILANPRKFIQVHVVFGISWTVIHVVLAIIAFVCNISLTEMLIVFTLFGPMILYGVNVYRKELELQDEKNFAANSKRPVATSNV